MKKNRQYAKTYRKLKPKPDYEAIAGIIRVASEAVISAAELHMVLSMPVPKFPSGGMAMPTKPEQDKDPLIVKHEDGTINLHFPVFKGGLCLNSKIANAKN